MFFLLAWVIMRFISFGSESREEKSVITILARCEIREFLRRTITSTEKRVYKMCHRINIGITIAVSFFILVIGSPISMADIIYVRASASDGGDGQSWATAYKYLQDAMLADATGQDEIWVAAGTYYPDMDESGNVNPNDKTETFQLINSVVIYGGLDGYEDPATVDLDLRDFSLNETILSGDIGRLDDPNDNCYSVVTGSGTDNSAILNGFTITAGNASNKMGYDLDPNNSGAGMFNDNGHPTVRHCVFRDNFAGFGGAGMANIYSNPVVTDCEFRDNQANPGSGGGMLNNFSTAQVQDCRFIGNYADYYGGAIYNNYVSQTISNCAFIGNESFGAGAVAELSTIDSRIMNCTFSGNVANGAYGGAIMMLQQSNTAIINCSMSNNSAPAGQGGGVVNAISTGIPTLTNCILWDNPGGEIVIYSAMSPLVTYSDIDEVVSGTGNIMVDPLFVDADGADDIAGTEDDNLHLLSYSPCINQGDPTRDYTGQSDMDGDGRVKYGQVDIGADEVFPVAGDFEPDEDVDMVDFATFAGHMLESPCDDPDWCGGADFNISTDVDLGDLVIFSRHWLTGN